MGDLPYERADGQPAAGETWLEKVSLPWLSVTTAVMTACWSAGTMAVGPGAGEDLLGAVGVLDVPVDVRDRAVGVGGG